MSSAHSTTALAYYTLESRPRRHSMSSQVPIARTTNQRLPSGGPHPQRRGKLEEHDRFVFAVLKLACTYARTHCGHHASDLTRQAAFFISVINL